MPGGLIFAGNVCHGTFFISHCCCCFLSCCGDYLNPQVPFSLFKSRFAFKPFLHHTLNLSLTKSHYSFFLYIIDGHQRVLTTSILYLQLFMRPCLSENTCLFYQIGSGSYSQVPFLKFCHLMGPQKHCSCPTL